MTNSTVSGNTARDEGGVWAVAANLLNSTVAENLAWTGGGLFHEPGGTFAVHNSIVALNLVTFVDPDVAGDFTTGGHNLIAIEGPSFLNGFNGDIVGDYTHPADPKLGSLAYNGGLTKTHRLLAGSWTIDAGHNANLPPTDQRGPGFPRNSDGDGDGRAVVDIGAFER